MRSGRWELMGEAMFRLKDRKGADLALGMTHEEIVATLATELSSYRELPQMWYQFQTKLRDEARPKAGLMRTREFTMKDSYSFDLDAAGLDKSFDLHRKAYARAFERLGIPAVPAEASNGTMGGSDSIEFVCPSETGEDDIIVCPTATTRRTGRRRRRRCPPWTRRLTPWRRCPPQSGSARQACARSRTSRPATTRPPTGRSRPWCTCSTGS